MKQAGLKGSWNRGNDSIKVAVPVMFFEENGTHIAYIPILDVSGYGESEVEAQESLKYSLDEYFSYTVSKGTLLEDLKAHGWIIKKKTKPFIAPDITDIINKNEYLHNIVNTIPYRMDRMDIAMPQYATC